MFPREIKIYNSSKNTHATPVQADAKLALLAVVLRQRQEKVS